MGDFFQAQDFAIAQDVRVEANGLEKIKMVGDFFRLQVQRLIHDELLDSLTLVLSDEDFAESFIVD